jgi:hypothetical protein
MANPKELTRADIDLILSTMSLREKKMLLQRVKEMLEQPFKQARLTLVVSPMNPYEFKIQDVRKLK